MQRRPWGSRGEPPAATDAAAWFSGAIPDDWFAAAPEVVVDRDEILVIGTLGPLRQDAEVSDAEREAAERGRISLFREETRERRIRVARLAEHRYRRKVSWGVVCGGTRELFTTHSAPVMTRLRQPERQVLDTLVDAGVARSRSEALAWCVRLVGDHTDQWLADLRAAMGSVDELRRRGPDIA